MRIDRRRKPAPRWNLWPEKWATVERNKSGQIASPSAPQSYRNTRTLRTRPSPGPVVDVNRNGSWTRWRLAQLPVIWKSAERSPILRLKSPRLRVARPGHSGQEYNRTGAASPGRAVRLTCPSRTTVTEGGELPFAASFTKASSTQIPDIPAPTGNARLAWMKLLTGNWVMSPRWCTKPNRTTCRQPASWT